MVTINKIYTKNGDKGTTHLVGGDRIEKCSTCICAVGDIDELNAYVGLARTLLEAESAEHQFASKTLLVDLISLMSNVQNILFDIGGIVATPAGVSWANMDLAKITESKINFLEEWIDRLSSQTPELKSFVLPGGTLLNSYLHISRAVCRRAERSLWKLNKELSNSLDPNLLIWMNRLSDLLFAMSRYHTIFHNKKEYLWGK